MTVIETPTDNRESDTQRRFPLRRDADPNCVCGHKRYDHRPTQRAADGEIILQECIMCICKKYKEDF